MQPTTSEIQVCPPRFAVSSAGVHTHVSEWRQTVMMHRMRAAGRAVIARGGAHFEDPNEGFEKVYDANSREKSAARIAAREARQEREEEEDAKWSWAERMLAIEEKAKAEARRAEDIYQRISASLRMGEKLYTPAEGKWWLRYENREEFAKALAEAKPSDLIARYAQSAEDRIRNGYVWEGGYIAGKYWQEPFVKTDLVSNEHWLLKRFVAGTARASSGLFKAGPTKDGMRAIWRKIIGFDEPYVLFGNRCKDMFRVDIDRWFESEAALNAWLDELMSTGRLAFRPHVAAWIFDDKRPGIWNPHLWFVLPEGRAVWGKKGPADEPAPEHVARHYRLLDQVIASLTYALGGDAGGLSNPYHGKSPVSVHCSYAILNEESFPTLSEYAKGMRLTHDSVLMARTIMTDRLKDVGFRRKESNTWFNETAQAAREAAKELYRSGFRIGDVAAFEESVYGVTLAVMESAMGRMDEKTRETVHKLVETCSRWAVSTFDPSKLDASSKNRGAAGHLIADDMTAKQKQGAGGSYSRGVIADRYCARVALEIRKFMETEGQEPTFADIVEATGFALNTVKKHWFKATVQAAAMLSRQSLVKGTDPTTTSKKPAKPSQTTLMTARSIDEIPNSWRNPEIIAHFDQVKRRDRRSGGPKLVRTLPGANLIDFMSAGSVRRYTAAKLDS